MSKHSHWLTKKRRKKMLKRLCYVAREINHTKDCNISRTIKEKGFRAFVERVVKENGVVVERMKTVGAPECTCGVDEADRILMRTIIILQGGGK